MKLLLRVVWLYLTTVMLFVWRSTWRLVAVLFRYIMYLVAVPMVLAGLVSAVFGVLLLLPVLMSGKNETGA